MAVTGTASESVTPTVNAYEPPAVGVPDNVPLDASNTNPAGNDPDVTDQLNGPTPPDAANTVTGYPTPTVAPGTDNVDTDNAATPALTVTVTAADVEPNVDPPPLYDAVTECDPTAG